MTDSTKKGINVFTAVLATVSILFIIVDKAFAPAVSKAELVSRIVQIEREQQKLCTIPEDLATIREKVEGMSKKVDRFEQKLDAHIEASHR
jgi:peptidoglycan hydrolase CwlO-like protein